MSVVRPLALLALLIGSAMAPMALGQVVAPSYLSFDLRPSSTFQFVATVGTATTSTGETVGQDAFFTVAFRDQSVDPNNSGGALPHLVLVDARIDPASTSDPAWDLNRQFSSSFYSTTGQVREIGFVVVHDVTVSDREIEVVLNVTMRHVYDQASNETVSKSVRFMVRLLPSPGLQMQIQYVGDPSAPSTAKPNQDVIIPVLIENTDLYPQQVDVRLIVAEGPGVDPSVLPATGGGVFLLEARGEPGDRLVVLLGLRMPKEKFYYGSETLQYTVLARTLEGDYSVQVDGVIAVQGFYVSTQLKVGTVLAILAAILALVVLVLARRYYNERILGRPIPPWRIPEEAVALRELKTTDPRAFYLLRYFVMEQEYQSALMWFHTYKKRAKREIESQAKSVAYMERAHALEQPDLSPFDRRAERIRRRIHRRQERQKLRAQVKIDKLQARLEQHYDEDFEKQHEKWAEKVEKLKKRANRPWYKAHKKWEVQVEKLLEEWEKPFRKEKEKREKEIAKAKGSYESRVKKEDKEAWKAWREAVENTEAENKVRKKEGREPLPMPELLSPALGPPELPPPFQEPPKPKLPAEPKPPKDLELPPEPQREKPVLSQSRYARKERRVLRKRDRKVRRLEKKLNRMLAKNERDRVKALARADRKRRKLLRKSERVTEPGLFARMFHLTPEDRERRNAQRLRKALAKERLRSLEEQESTRLEVLRVSAEREEAELMAKLIRERAEVRKGSTSAGMGASVVEADEEELKRLRSEHEARLERERRASEERLAKARAKIEEELAASPARSEAAPGPAKAVPSEGKRSRAPARAKK